MEVENVDERIRIVKQAVLNYCNNIGFNLSEKYKKQVLGMEDSLKIRTIPFELRVRDGSLEEFLINIGTPANKLYKEVRKRRH